MPSRISCLALALAATACASSTVQSKSKKQRASTAVSDAGDASSLRIPKILATAPEGAVDLGPVLIPMNASGGAGSDRALLEAADRLDADAFVFERKSLRKTYAIRTVRVQSLYDSSGRPDRDLSETVYFGSVSGGGDPGVGFYRALALPKREPELCPSELVALRGKPGEIVDGAESGREQLRLVVTLFANGLLPLDEFRRARRACVPHWSAAVGSASPTEP